MARNRTAKKIEITTERAIELLSLFIEKVEVLRTSSLISSLASDKASHSDNDASVTTKAYMARERTVHSDSLDAFFLTLRLFLQDNEEISIHNISAVINSLHNFEEQKKNISKQRELLNGFLGRKAAFSILGDRPTNWDILETVLYGYHGHLNQYQRYKKWTKGPFGVPLIYLELIWILCDLTSMLIVLANNFRKIVKGLADASANAENSEAPGAASRPGGPPGGKDAG